MFRKTPGIINKENNLKNRKKAFCTELLQDEKFSDLKPPHRRYPLKSKNQKNSKSTNSYFRSLPSKKSNSRKSEREKD